MITVAARTQLMWTVALLVGVVVFIVVIILLNLLLGAVRTLDERVDLVWSSAVGVFVHTLTAAPQLRAAERHARSLSGLTDDARNVRNSPGRQR
jgi:antibiotic biosynthesis monooxygenase (ABM) superfamily enzyme